MTFTLPDLPYSKDDLSDFCSSETFNYHHGKHHQAYITNLNKFITDTDYADLSLTEIIRKSSQEGNSPIFNNAAQHFNHSFFWQCLTSSSSGQPVGELAEKINQTFGSFDEFKSEFVNKSLTLFGAGWCWLVKNSEGELEILQLPNAGTPLAENKTPILTLDVWEHAYYIDFRNDRLQFANKFFDYLNWDFAKANFNQAI